MMQKDTKLRFWCQKVLPLVYDDSLSYYELLNKVVLHLNQHTEDINALIDFYDTFAEDVEAIINQMMEDGEFNEIIADTLGNLIAEEYDPTQTYYPLDYVIYESKLYASIDTTTGEWDETKWRNTTVANELNTLMSRVFNISASNVVNDSSVSGDNVDDALDTLKNDIDSLSASEIANDSTVSGTNVDDALDTLNTNIDTINNDISYLKWVGLFSSDTAMTTQADSLPHSEGGFFGKVIYAAATALPTQTSGYIIVLPYNINYKRMYYFPISTNDTWYMIEKKNGTWMDWVQLPDSTAIASIVSSISTLSGNITTIEGNISTINGNISTINGNISTINGKVSALETATTPQAFTPETSTDVTLTNPKFFKINKLTLINTTLNLANSVSSGVTFISNLPRPTSLTWIVLINTGNNTSHPCYITSGGELKPSGAIAAGEWIISASYIADLN